MEKSVNKLRATNDIIFILKFLSSNLPLSFPKPRDLSRLELENEASKLVEVFNLF